MCDFYIDDLLTGANSIREAKLARDHIIQLLQLGGFTLSKWASNCSYLLEGLTDQREDLVAINLQAASTVLGINWNQVSDTFHFCYEAELLSVISKRTILSELSKLFDPLGLLGLVMVLAKRILQELWQAGTHCDELPPDIHTRWVKLMSHLIHSVNHLKLPRCVKFQAEPKFIQVTASVTQVNTHTVRVCTFARKSIAIDFVSSFYAY